MILREVVGFYGADMQLNICIEELSELIKELCKSKRGLGDYENIAEEMADVRIIMEQLYIIYGNADAVQRWYLHKLNRLQERLEIDRVKGGAE